jgi:metallo-beta-lactamase family protein
MALSVEFHGAARQVTGSLYVIRSGTHTVLLECGLVQGGKKEELRNAEPFPVSPESIDAVVLSHAHIDHSGRVPLLVKRGYRGPVYVQRATGALCSIMLPDSGYLNEKDAQWENKRRTERDEPRVEPLYTRAEAEACLAQFKGLRYGDSTEIVPGLTLTFHDAGHILGSSIVELRQRSSEESVTVVFSGDLGNRDAPVMNPPERLSHADVVLMESTYGDRLHRPFAETMVELREVFESARASRGNILIPAFTVGRTQDLLYLMAENFEEWGLSDWQIFLDSPMGIDATRVYGEYRHLYGARLFGPESSLPDLDNFHMTHTTEESMMINGIEAGAIIIAGSGMLSGGRIHHHLKNNIWKPGCHLVIAGYQAVGTLGRRIVDGVEEIRLWGDTYPVRAQVHTIGGLSAHADRDDLVDWYSAFEGRPPVYLVHGEERAQTALAATLRAQLDATVNIPKLGDVVNVGG